MTRDEWKQQQIELLILAGMSLFDATSLVEELLKRVPEGSEEDFQPDLYPDLVRYTEQAIRDARADWMARESVPADKKRILEASEGDPRDRRRDLLVIGLLGWLFSPQDGKYYPDERGEPPLSEDELHNLLVEVVNSRFGPMVRLTEQLQSGAVSPAVWVDAVHRELRRMMFQGAALGAGGHARLSSQDLAALNSLLNNQRGYLVRFADNLVSGRLSMAQAASNLELYTGETFSVFWNASGRRLNAAVSPGDVMLEKRNLNPAEHCDDCIRYAGMGWQLFGVLPEPGRESECMAKCKCTKSRMIVPANEVADWLGTRR